jgi:hypothetical protein
VAEELAIKAAGRDGRGEDLADGAAAGRGRTFPGGRENLSENQQPGRSPTRATKVQFMLTWNLERTLGR